MKNHDCDGCFYQYKDHQEYPCNGCFMNSRFVHQDVFKDVDNSPVFKQTGKLSWEFNPADALRKTFGAEDPYDGFYGGSEEYASRTYDTVNKPKHYMLFDEFQVKSRAKDGSGIEVRDVLEMLVLKLETRDGLFQSDYVQMMQYVMRFMDKNGVEDLKKARWYLDKMIDAYD